jgi:hypothetical protein
MSLERAARVMGTPWSWRWSARLACPRGAWAHHGWDRSEGRGERRAARQAARRSSWWCRPTSGTRMIRPALGGCVGRGIGASLSSERWGRQA